MKLYWILGRLNLQEWTRIKTRNRGDRLPLPLGAAAEKGEGWGGITSELTLRPGLIAFLYKLRWDLEKVFDALKNKLNESQAWSTADHAKSAQAQLICRLHNRIQILEETLRWGD